MMRAFKEGLFRAGEKMGLGRIARWRHRGDLRIVTYHGVDTVDDPVVNYDRLQVDPDLFRQHVEALASRYRVSALGTLLASVKQGDPWPEHALAITFDDGYRNNHAVAAPILRQLGVPATFFVTHDYLSGRDYPWWYQLRAAIANTHLPEVESPGGDTRLSLRTVGERISAALRWERDLVCRPLTERRPRLAALLAMLREVPQRPYPMMTVVEARRLGAEGFELGTHTMQHISCRYDPPGLVLQDVEASMHALVALGVQRPPVLAYPYGHVPEDLDPLRAVLDAHGVAGAVTTEMGGNPPRADRMQLRRFDLHGNRTVAGVIALCSGLGRCG